MKTWTKLAIFVVVVAAVVAWYIFRPERLWVNRQVDEAMPTAQGSSSPQPLESGRSTVFCTRRKAPQPSTRWATERVFFALRASARQTVRMYTFIWLRLTMRRTTLQWKKPALLTWERSRETSATKTTLLATIWTSGNTAPCPYGANDSA